MMTILSTIAGFLMTLIQALLQVPLIWVGEAVLFLITFGRHKPRWDIYLDSGGSDFAFLSEASLWVGVATICGLGGAIKFFFFDAPL